MKLSIIIPCFNEINTVLKLVNSVINSPVKDKEIIIVDDFSTDGTRDQLSKINNEQVRIIYHDKKVFSSCVSNVCI